jgi:hypothetical protein
VGRSDVGPRVTHVLGIVVVNLRGTSGNTLYRVLLLVYVPRETPFRVLLLVNVGPRATHVIGYCRYLYYVAPRATLYWLLLLVYEGPRTTHFTGYCRGSCEALGNTLYWASLGLMWGTFINGFKTILFLKY